MAETRTYTPDKVCCVRACRGNDEQVLIVVEHATDEDTLPEVFRGDGDALYERLVMELPDATVKHIVRRWLRDRAAVESGNPASSSTAKVEAYNAAYAALLGEMIGALSVID